MVDFNLIIISVCPTTSHVSRTSSSLRCCIVRGRNFRRSSTEDKINMNEHDFWFNFQVTTESKCDLTTKSFAVNGGHRQVVDPCMRGRIRQQRHNASSTAPLTDSQRHVRPTTFNGILTISSQVFPSNLNIDSSTCHGRHCPLPHPPPSPSTRSVW